ncbi:hypothetical protein [Streptomyces sp. NPDC004629]|uniref:hypothetical protein n=1 Tax=Streptomyces sp. NPDC004629 TaxID=3364705 RepID=UPI00369D03F5
MGPASFRSAPQKAKEDLEKIHERHRAESERLIAVLGEVLEAAKDAVGFDRESVTLPTSVRKQNLVYAECGKAVLERLERAGGLAKLSEDHELVSAHHGDNYAPLMRRHFGQPVGAGDVHRQRILFDKHKPGKINRRHFEVCTLFYLTQELRTGDVAVIDSESYANLHDQLLSWQACEPLVADYCEQA